jgi:hypothetical protein
MRDLILRVFAIVICYLSSSCGPISELSHETPEPCKKVFQPDKIDFAAAKDFSIKDLIEVEKCGFQYHPNISFYGEIISSREYPMPSLLKELSRSDNGYWTAHLVYLIKEVIESEKFHFEVMRDRTAITEQVEESQTTVSKSSTAYEDIQNLNDGIKIYYLKQDGVKF